MSTSTRHACSAALVRTYLGGGDKGVRRRVGVVPGGEIPVEGRDDCVLLSLFHILPERITHTHTHINSKNTQVELVTGGHVPNGHLSHCPMQGPHALARTTPPTSPRIFDYRKTQTRLSVSSHDPETRHRRSARTLTYPSLSMVARICSEPGVTVN